ncbi:hypothetical protein V493_02797 [Pseudogymnoascus sp. VKM F-4281 (FW-2241)]|nr:hypothetical protein V493_02797 [Pseudogymnoascus sp. VKM F-4281 (FW-2241)]
MLVTTIIFNRLFSLIEAASNTQAELDTLIAEVTSTRAALGPLERYVRLRSPDERSQKVILTMMADLRELEDQLFAGIEYYLRAQSTGYFHKILWGFKHTALKEIASRISTQKITILALQVAELTQQTVILVQNSASQERALTEFLQTNPNASVESLSIEQGDGDTNITRRTTTTTQDGGAGEGDSVQYRH